MYFANTAGAVLQFDGNNWNKIKIPNQAIYSFAKDNKGKIYVGAKTDLGFLEPTPNGELKFVSLLNKIPLAHKEFKRIRNINILKDSSICFQTQEEIFILKNDTFEVFPVEVFYEKGLYLRSFYTNERLFTFIKGSGIYEFKDETLKIIKGSEIFKNDFIRGIVPYNDNLIIVTWYQGIYLYENKKFTKKEITFDDKIYKNIYKTFCFAEDYYAFSLNNGGLIITNKELKPVQYITSDYGLQNDIIRNLYFDNQDNLWLCLDNGIACLTPFTPFTKFDTNFGFANESKTLMSILFNKVLYIGTKTGVYYKEWNNDDIISPKKFTRINNPKGNLTAYSLQRVDNDLICANSFGIFSIIDNNANFFLEKRRVRTFKQLKTNKNVLIGGADGLLFFYKKNKQWTFIDNVKNFDEYSRYIEEDKNGELWMSSNISGIYKIFFKDSFSVAEKFIQYDTVSGLKGLPDQAGNYVFKINDKIVFGTKKGIYKYVHEKDTFIPYDKLNNAIRSTHPITMLKQDSSGNIWFKQQIALKDDQVSWELGVILNKKDSLQVLKKPFYKYKNKIFSFNQIDKHTYIIGAVNGFVHYDSRIKIDYEREYPSFVRNVKLTKNDSIIFGGIFPTEDNYIGLEQRPEHIHTLPYQYNDMRISYSAAFYDDPEGLQFSIYLKGNDDNWSDWTNECFRDYSNLSPGTYTFFVKAKNIYEKESTIAKYIFVIKRPWYSTIIAFIIYIILFVLFVWGIIYLYTRRLRRQKEQLEILVIERTVEIQQQKEEIEAQRDQVSEQNEVINKKNKDITASIEYAKRIQTAMLPLDNTIDKHLKEHFILFKPRDIVSGDFYWFQHTPDNKTIITAVDCTGHGVPGAFMSMIGSEILTTIVSKGVTDAGKILDMKNQYVRNALKQETGGNQDGMDMALCVIDKEKKTVEFAGAKNPILIIKNDKITKIKGDRQSIGGHQIMDENFKKHIIPIDDIPTYFYIFSDGFQDQFGGPSKRKFMIKRMKQMILDNHKKPMPEQKQILDAAIIDWMKDTFQTDDIIVIGFKL